MLCLGSVSIISVNFMLHLQINQLNWVITIGYVIGDGQNGLPNSSITVKHLTRDSGSSGSNSSLDRHFFLFLYVWFRANPWNWQVNSCQGKEPRDWDLRWWRSFKGGEMWWSEWFNSGAIDSSAGRAPD